MCPAISEHRVLAYHPASVGAARRFVRGVLGGRTAEETVEAAEIVVSELVTNVVVHAGTPVEVEVRLEDSGTVWLGVTDGAPHRSLRGRTGVERSTGRGLMMVASLAREWGVALEPGRKLVWCRLDQADGDPGGEPEDDVGSAGVPAGRTCEVELGDVPLQVYLSWSEDAEALLRDYLLSGLEETAFEDSLRRHAECSDALARLAEAFSAAVVDNAGAPNRREDPGITVTLTVPTGVVEEFSTLSEVLDSAVRTAAGDRYLSTASSSTSQNFRRWLCREVLAQARGAPPTAWREDSQQ